MKKRATIEDVAQMAGVSRQTVSRAINDKGEISPATKERVLKAIEQLGYRPNRLAQGMVTQRTFTIGLILSNIANPFFPEITHGVQDAAQAKEYNVFLCNTDDNAIREMQELQSLAARGVDGIILFSHQASDADLVAFANTYRPIVVINRVIEHPNVSVMMVKNYYGGQLAADYFIDQGHTQLGMLTNDIPSGSQVRRVRGFRERIQERGLTLPDDRLITAPASLEGGRLAAHQLLDDHAETSAIFTYNDLMALGAIRACGERGLRIPDDVAIIGFDDISFAAMATPSLSSVRVDKYALGQKAMARLVAMIDAPETNFPLEEINVELILRESA